MIAAYFCPFRSQGGPFGLQNGSHNEPLGIHKTGTRFMYTSLVQFLPHLGAGWAHEDARSSDSGSGLPKCSEEPLCSSVLTSVWKRLMLTRFPFPR